MKASLLKLGVAMVAVFAIAATLAPGAVSAQGVAEEAYRSRDVVIDLDDDLTTDAQLMFPVVGSGPFPGVLLVHGSGPMDMDEYLPPEASLTGEPVRPFLQIAEYLSSRGFAVLRYHKRYVGDEGIVLDEAGWASVTFQDLKRDAETMLKVLAEQPEVDVESISIVGHSEGAILAPRIAIDNPEVKNVVLMAASAQGLSDLVHFQMVQGPIYHAEQTIDTNRDGLLSIEEVYATRELQAVFLNASLLIENSTGEWLWRQGLDTDGDGYLSIHHELRPWLESHLEMLVTSEAMPMHTWLHSVFALEDTLDIIDAVPASILIQQGEGDIQTPVSQAYLLEQKLTSANHPDHTLITYPGLGHTFYPAVAWNQPLGPIQEGVLHDLHGWLKDRDRDSRTVNSRMEEEIADLESNLNDQMADADYRIGDLEAQGAQLQSDVESSKTIAYISLSIAAVVALVAARSSLSRRRSRS